MHVFHVLQMQNQISLVCEEMRMEIRRRQISIE